jgi:hypothetical protein
MIERDKGNVIFVCDTCEKKLETHLDDFKEAFAMFRREGWKTERVGKDWIHGCEDCGT